MTPTAYVRVIMFSRISIPVFGEGYVVGASVVIGYCRCFFAVARTARMVRLILLIVS